MRSRIVRRMIIGLCLALIPCSLVAQEPRELTSFAEIRELIDQHFAEQSHLRVGDIICQNDVRSLFTTLEASGWIVENRDEILNMMLSANDPLIRILRSSKGTKFMSQVASDKLIYDRLDRISRVSGGQRLLADLIKLPDAARFAKQMTRPGVPDLEDLLPKDRSGKTRRVKDYDKATGKIYTAADFKKALQESYELTQRKGRV